MKFFIDTADINEIRDLAATGLVDGVTTNPSLVAKSGRKFLDVVREICGVVPGPVSAEVTATDLKVTGHIPEHLDGRYLRNGPNPAEEVDPATYHWFTGDGMVHGIRLRDGRSCQRQTGERSVLPRSFNQCAQASAARFDLWHNRRSFPRRASPLAAHAAMERCRSIRI